MTNISKRQNTLHDVMALKRARLISDENASKLDKICQQYDVAISPHVQKQLTDLSTPVLSPIGRQYIPSLEELNVKSYEESDPISDHSYSPVKGIVHRYADRVLFKVTPLCAVYCRYCFRKEMIGKNGENLKDQDIENAISYIKSHPEIWEVILTGGDPLILSTRRLTQIFDALGQIDHVKMVRIHTRVPVASPERFEETILSVLKEKSFGISIVLHINHADEISDPMRQIVEKMHQGGARILSQSVLLRDINDDPIILEQLFRTLVQINITPYYLHHLDRARGTSHFHVPLSEGMKIMENVQGRVSGICLPKYMLDIPGGHGKIPINNSTVRFLGGSLYEVQDYKGCKHIYIDHSEREPKNA